MFKKKDIDVTSIVKKAYISTKKEQGMIVEQGAKKPQTAFNEPYNPEDDLGFMSVSPKQWGVKGTIQAAQLDKIIEAVLGSVASQKIGTTRFKASLTKLNSILGKAPSSFSMPTKKDSLESIEINAQNLFSSLALNSLLHAVIANQDASVAGKMFEGLAARMLGGETIAGKAIQDIEMQDGKYISLKLIDPNVTNIKGSVYNLAYGIANSQDNSVGYIVCQKNKLDNPFSFKTFSFVINKYNYFNFMLKKEIITVEDIRGINKSSKSSKFVPPTYDTDENFFEDAIRQYAINSGAAEDDKSINLKIKSILNPSNDIAFKDQLEKIKPLVSPALWDNYISKLVLPVTKGEGGKPIKLASFKTFRDAIKNLTNALKDDDRRIEFFEDDQDEISNLKIAKDEQERETKKNSLLVRNSQKYVQKINTINKLLENIISFADGVEKELNNLSSVTKIAAIQRGQEHQAALNSDETLKAEIDLFFANFKDHNFFKTIDPQMDITVPQAKHLAMVTGGDYDDSYEEFIVEKGYLFTNSEKSTEVLKKYLIPLLEPLHNTKNALKRFYIEDEPSGIVDAKTNLDRLQGAIKDVPTDTAASQLKENIDNKPLTKHWSDDILKDILND